MILNIKRVVAFCVGLSISIILFMPSTTEYIKESTPTLPVDDEPALLPAPEPQILATSSSTTEPEPLPAGVICLEDCPLFLDPNDGVEDTIREHFKDKPVLIVIAKCESTFRQWDDTGKVLMNYEGSSATGAMQIMSSYHRKTATNLGWNISTLEGNLAYAEYLYDREGVRPWMQSSGCWKRGDMAINKGISDNDRVSPTLLSLSK